MPSWKVSAALFSLLAAGSSAFTVAPPPQEIVFPAGATTSIQQSSSALPSQKDLLKSSSSTTLISAATSAAAPVPTKPAATATTATAAAPAGIFVTDVKCDGQVPKTEADEYVTIANTSKAPMDVSGYYLYVATSGSQGTTFTFPKDSVVKPGQSVRVYTNEIHKESGGYSFGIGKAIWNNKGGLAVLRDAKGNKVSEFKYKGTTSA